MFNFILEIIFTFCWTALFILNIITGSWAILIILDGLCMILGIINCCLIYRNLKHQKENQNVSSDN